MNEPTSSKSSMSTSIDINNLCLTFETQTEPVHALSDINLQVNSGDFVTLIGPSGCGKTTLLRVIADLEKPTSGKITVEGKSPHEARLDRSYGYVFQTPALFPWRNIESNIHLPLEMSGYSKDEQKKLSQQYLSLVSLIGFEKKYPWQLSGGMQQRVGLARALAVDPEIMLFDEPFSALDPLIRREMQDELLRLQSVVRKTMVFITHDFLEAIKMGDHIAIMKDGEFVQIGTPEEIVANPVDDYVRDFSEDVPRHKVLTVNTIMSTDCSRCYESDTVTSALATMDKHESQATYVVSANNSYRGTLTRKQATNASGSGASITDLLQIDTATSPEALIETLIADATRLNHPIPVVDSEHKLIGAVDHRAILKAIEGTGSKQNK